MEAALVAGATIIVKGIADITIEQLRAYIKRKQEMRQEQGTKTR